MHAAPAGEPQTHVSALCMLPLCQQRTTLVPTECQQCHALAVHLQVGFFLKSLLSTLHSKCIYTCTRALGGFCLRQAWVISGLLPRLWGLAPKLNMRHLDSKKHVHILQVASFLKSFHVTIGDHSSLAAAEVVKYSNVHIPIDCTWDFCMALQCNRSKG